MRMTYFRCPQQIRHMMKIEMRRSQQSYQAAINDILTEHFKEKLQLFELCIIIANKTNLNKEKLYLVALSAEHSDQLAHILPQINKELSVVDALDELSKKPLDRAWVGIDNFDEPDHVYLTDPGAEIRAVEVPLIFSIKEQLIEKERIED